MKHKENMMSTRATIFATIFLIAFAIVFSLSVFDRLPEQMASHWNTANQVDGYMSRFWGAFLMPIVAIGMLALFLIIPNIDPLKANIAKFRNYFNAFIALMVGFLVYVHSPGFDIRLRGDHDASGQTQLLYRYPHTMDVEQ